MTEASTPKPRHPHYALTDGVRGIASIMLVVIHVAIFTLPLGDDLIDHVILRLDVVFPIFFVLSAFLLYRPMIAHRTGGAAPPSLRGFAVRRGLRIYPAYWFALTALAIFPGLLGVFGSETLAVYSLANNLDQPFTNPECNDYVFRCGLPQTWSLTAEMTFYIALPFYAALTGLIARGRRTRDWVRIELGLIIALGIISAVLSVGPFGFRDESWFRFSLLGNMLWLGVGLAFAVVSVALQNREQRPRLLEELGRRPGACWAAAFAIWLTLVLTLPAEPYIVATDTDLEWLITYSSFALVSVLVMLPVLFPGDGRGAPRRLLRVPFISWLGSIAMGIFLWHVTIAYNLGFGAIGAGFWTTLLFTLLLTIPLAALSFYAIERPLMAPRSIFWRDREKK